MTEVAESRKSPRGRSGSALMRTGQHRTHRGAIVQVREWWHRPRHQRAYRYVEARRGGELLGEYTATRPGNAAMVYECFLAGVFDLHTPIGDLPPGLSRAMGRVWMKAEPDRQSPVGIAGERDFSGHREAEAAFVPGDATPVAGPADQDASEVQP